MFVSQGTQLKEKKSSIFNELKYMGIEEDYILNSVYQRYELYEVEGLDCYYSDNNLLPSINYFNKEFLDLKNATIEFFMFSKLRDPIIQREMKDADYIKKQRLAYLDKKKKVKKVNKYISISTDKFSKKFDETHPVNSELHQNFLDMFGLNYRKLNTQEIKSFLYSIISMDDQFRVSPYMTPREELIQSQIRYFADCFQIGEYYLKVISLKHIPEETEFFDFDYILDFFMFDFIFSSSLTVLDQEKEKTRLTLMRNTAQSAKYKSETRNHQAEQNLEDAETLKSIIQREGHLITVSNSKIILYSKNPEVLRDRARYVINEFKKAGYFFIEEELFHDKEFFRTLPAQTILSQRGSKTLGYTSLSMFPLSKVVQGEIGESHTLYLRSTSGQLFGFNAGTKSRINWNSMVFGASGSGKSVTMNMLIEHSMYPRIKEEGGRIFIVDFAGAENSSYRKMSQLFGGKFIPIDSTGKYSINPFPKKSDFMINGEPDAEAITFLNIIIDMIIGNNGNDTKANLKRNMISKAIKALYNEVDEPRLGHLTPYIEQIKTDEVQLKDEIIKLLDGFVHDSPESKIINSETNIDYASSPFVIFDLQGINSLTDNMKQLMTFIVVNETKKTAFKEKGFKFIIFDEVAQLIKNPAMINLLDEMYSTARKYLTSIWTITQNFLNYKESGLSSKIKLNSSSTWFLSHAQDAEAKRLVAQDFGFTEHEKAAFESLKTVKGEYSLALVKTATKEGEQSSVVRIELSPFDYQTSTSDKEDNSYIEKVAKENNCTIIRACQIIAKEKKG